MRGADLVWIHSHRCFIQPLVPVHLSKKLSPDLSTPPKPGLTSAISLKGSLVRTGYQVRGTVSWPAALTVALLGVEPPGLGPASRRENAFNGTRAGQEHRRTHGGVPQSEY